MAAPFGNTGVFSGNGQPKEWLFNFFLVLSSFYYDSRLAEELYMNMYLSKPIKIANLTKRGKI